MAFFKQIIAPIYLKSQSKVNNRACPWRLPVILKTKQNEELDRRRGSQVEHLCLTYKGDAGQTSGPKIHSMFSKIHSMFYLFVYLDILIEFDLSTSYAIGNSYFLGIILSQNQFHQSGKGNNI
jgi:hypothetical protein